MCSDRCNPTSQWTLPQDILLAMPILRSFHVPKVATEVGPKEIWACWKSALSSWYLGSNRIFFIEPLSMAFKQKRSWEMFHFLHTAFNHCKSNWRPWKTAQFLYHSQFPHIAPQKMQRLKKALQPLQQCTFSPHSPCNQIASPGYHYWIKKCLVSYDFGQQYDIFK